MRNLNYLSSKILKNDIKFKKYFMFILVNNIAMLSFLIIDDVIDKVNLSVNSQFYFLNNVKGMLIVIGVILLILHCIFLLLTGKINSRKYPMFYFIGFSKLQIACLNAYLLQLLLIPSYILTILFCIILQNKNIILLSVIKVILDNSLILAVSLSVVSKKNLYKKGK